MAVPPAPGLPALRCLVLILKHHGIAVDPSRLMHEFGDRKLSDCDIITIARRYKLKARRIETTWQRLQKTPMPVMAVRSAGDFIVLGRCAPAGATVYDPGLDSNTGLSQEDFAAAWTGQIILFARSLSLDTLGHGFNVAWFLRAAAKYKHIFIEVLAGSFVLQILALATPLFFQVIIDKVLVHHGLTTLDVLIIGLVIVSVFESILTGLRTYIFSHTTTRIDVELGAKLFRHLISLPAAYFAVRRTGDSVARVRELENIRTFLTSSALTLTIDLFFTFVFLAIMLAYSPMLSLVVLLSLPCYIAISYAVKPTFRRYLDEKFNRGAETQSFLVETVAGIETLKSMAVEPQIQRRWEDRLAAYVTASFNVLNLSNWSSQGIQLINKLNTAALLYFGAHAVISGTMTVGELVAFNMLAGRVAQPVLRLAQVWQDFHQTKNSIDRLGDILGTPPEPMMAEGKMVVPTLKGEIRFEGIDFRYSAQGNDVLSSINLHIPAGQVVGIVGASGSGKSTLTKLIQRLYLPTAGRVKIDGIDLAAVEVSSLRRQVGVVLQDNVLFNRTIRDNIALANPSAPIEHVMQAARLAGAHEFILELPQGYETIIGERGDSLSGGQRQRIAIARTLMTNPRILILDEATSALDYQSEQIVQANMRSIAKGRTVIIIAHRLSAVRHCDRIITLDRGKIVEDGDHAALLLANGHYAALHRLQEAGLAS